ncbi:peptide-methionine (S)-S-oxide reductase MsrA [Weissella tructae]|uniref:Peptide methionine sulfoxide reductase MsrA n=2 Tax=Weissella TaxID=46255 RepID=A0A075U5Z9_9LACO|nr:MULTISPECIES: peptide-methionine (S)-S-oxide reductase MsrA [Weissella]AIG65542.1 Peptide methionine sulfoxide reductase MsrA [Weissella tructae]AIM62856.1 Peptide methionine sulfoxide reductase MsrA [Weissella ceti]AIM64191.1 Peptide methionine sulfoxide reductase MsrA [Weissella ceti]ELA06998.1 methionine sulfoxide reductase A [Weissella ceti NC36]QVV91913.1 peptide-methionine (S)-S-oxide reductase MsrA [Weissella tructae]
MGRNLERAIFAGGCFWCMVEPFEEKDGIETVLTGYTGGTTVNPTYEEVCTHLTGHTEAVEIIYDADIISYQELLDIYWQQTDPTDEFGQFFDRGPSYRPAIFYTTDEQRILATESKKALDDSHQLSRPVVTSIEPAAPFYVAEDYHQQYYKKNPIAYQQYHAHRERILEQLWH